MKNIFKSILGIVALGAVGAAHAAIVTLPHSPTGPSLHIGDTGIVPVTLKSSGSFTDNFYFSLASTSSLKVALGGLGFSTLVGELYDDTTHKVVDSGLSFTLPSLTGGNDYDLIVKGKSPLGGIFAGVVHVSPAAVPIPAAAWLLLSGLVGVGAVARRRKSEA
jgi:hypothetical protein